MRRWRWTTPQRPEYLLTPDFGDGPGDGAGDGVAPAMKIEYLLHGDREDHWELENTCAEAK